MKFLQNLFYSMSVGRMAGLVIRDYRMARVTPAHTRMDNISDMYAPVTAHNATPPPLSYEPLPKPITLKPRYSRPWVRLEADSPFPFGRYKGEMMTNIPASYYDWLSGQSWLRDWPAVADYITRKKNAMDFEL